MALNFIKTNEEAVSNGIKIVNYGLPGVGKTIAIATAPTPFIMSAEAGLLSLANVVIPGLSIKTMADLSDAYQWVSESGEAKPYETICVDSITEIAETVLTHAKETNKDPRNAYGDLIDKMTGIIKGFRDLKEKHVYISAKEVRIKDDFLGKMYSSPAMPGQVLGPGLAYYFDEVFHMETARTEEDGSIYRLFRTVSDDLCVAKDRSGHLNDIEEPHLGKIIEKIKKGVNQKEVKNGTV